MGGGRLMAMALCLAIAACDPLGGDVRDQVRVVGSGTVYPFAQAVSERFVRDGAGRWKAPIIEATGTGAGIKLFCAGVGARYPDLTNASRRMKASEFRSCAANGVSQVAEVQIGLDGISIAGAKNGVSMSLRLRDVYAALAARPFGKPQTARTWADVNPALPAIPIAVYGPPSTSGTRDALSELILAKGCDNDPAMQALKQRDEARHKRLCTQVREDGVYVDAGENDNLIVQKLVANPQALGVFGFSFFEENQDRLKDVPLDGVLATYDTISSFRYPGARPLYIYVKLAHLRAVPGLRQFVGSFAPAIVPNGYLKARGMIVAPPAVVAQSLQELQTLRPLAASALK